MRYPYGYIYPLYFPYIPQKHIMDNLKKRPILTRSNPIRIKTQEIKYEDKYIKEDLKFPQLEGLDSEQSQRFINNSIESDIMEFKRQMEVAAKEYGEEAERNGEEFKPFIISSIYEVTYNKHNIISISIIYHEYIGGINSYIKASYNFNIETGESLSLKDLFKEGVDYQKLVNNEVRNELLYNEEKYFPGAAEKFKGIAKYHPFYIKNGNLVVYFGFHEIAPVASQIPEIEIPFSALRNYIKPKFFREP